MAAGAAKRALIDPGISSRPARTVDRRHFQPAGLSWILRQTEVGLQV